MQTLLPYLTEPHSFAVLASFAVVLVLAVGSAIYSIWQGAKRMWARFWGWQGLCRHIGHRVDPTILQKWCECRAQNTIPLNRHLRCNRCKTIIDEL